MTRAVGARTPPATGRIVGVDVARALAIIGMLAVNVGPKARGGVSGWLYSIPHGRASVLFVLLAGLGVALLTRRRRPVQRWRVLGWRAGLLLLAGLALQLLDHDVNVILQTYGVLFLLAALALPLPDGALLAAAAVVTVAGPVAWLGRQLAAGGDADPDPPALGDAAGPAVEALLLTGPYPVVTWLAPFLLGVWLGRRDLADHRLQRRLVVVGLAGTVAAPALSRLLTAATGGPVEEPGPRMLLTNAAHGQMPLWLVGSSAAAVAALGLCLVVLARPAPAPGPVARGGARWARPLVAAGQLSLTIYVLHLVALHFLRPLPHDLLQGVVITAAMTVLALLGATAWRQRFRRGPLEALLRVPWAAR